MCCRANARYAPSSVSAYSPGGAVRFCMIMLLVFGCVDDAERPGDAETAPDAFRSQLDGTPVDVVSDSMPITDGSQTAPQDAEVDAAQQATDAGARLDGDAHSPGAGMSEPDTGDPLVGSVPTSCGSPGQGLTPVDCTREGDESAQCVFSNHCLCAEGFSCQQQTQWPGTPECDPGAICIPNDRVGSFYASCGSPDAGMTPVDCRAGGDREAYCVFGDHCACSDGFVCANTDRPGECDPGETCQPGAE